MIATFKTRDFVGNLKAALLAASDDFTRPNQNCIRVELEDKTARFVATNGHWLWINEASYSEVVGVDDKGKKIFGTSSATIHISITSVKAILKWIDKGKKANDRDVSLDTVGNVRQVGLSAPFEFKPLDVTFPPYAQVIPATVTASKDVMTYDPEYIVDVMAAFVEVASDPNVGICFEHAGELDPVVVTSDKSSALAVLMPRRHPNKPAGASLIAKYRAEPKGKAA
jgi:hypothetical protein